jgi:hypothetical protein
LYSSVLLELSPFLLLPSNKLQLPPISVDAVRASVMLVSQRRTATAPLHQTSSSTRLSTVDMRGPHRSTMMRMMLCCDDRDHNISSALSNLNPTIYPPYNPLKQATLCASGAEISMYCNKAENMTRFLLFLLVAVTLQHQGQAGRLSRFAVPLSVRGGSVVAKKDDLQAYRLQQQLYLQSRSLQLRQALIDRGLDALQHGDAEQTVVKSVDWDCTLTTEDNPKQCLISFEAEVGAKVIAPIGTDQWVTITSLNQIRRHDPPGVEKLWHSQYSILRTWFRPDSSFSLYNHLTPFGALLSVLLDAPALLSAVLLGTLLTGFLLTLPIWERLLSMVLTSKLLWRYWPKWGHFLHCALPLKLFLVQTACTAIATAFTSVYNLIRSRLIELECQILQECIPLTIIPKEMDDKENEEEDPTLINVDDD